MVGSARGESPWSWRRISALRAGAAAALAAAAVRVCGADGASRCKAVPGT